MTRMRRRNRQSGQAVVIIVAIIVALTVLGVMVFDAGLAMSDRRNLQAYADASALAGSRSYGPGGSRAHWIAMEYLTGPLGFSLPVGGCASAANCGAGTYVTGGYTVTLVDSWRANGILNYPSVLDVVISHRQPSIFARMIGFSTLTSAAAARATIPGPQFNGANYAVAAVNGDALINGGGAAFQTVTGPVYAYGSFGANNSPHSTGVPSVQTNFDGTTCPGGPANHLDNGGGNNSLDYHTTDGNTMPQNPDVAPPSQYENAAQQTFSRMLPTIMQDAKELGITFHVSTINGAFPTLQTTNKNIAIAIFPGWAKDYADALTFFNPLFDGRTIIPQGNVNYSLVGMKPSQAKALGVKGTITGLPSVDSDLDRCAALAGQARLTCYEVLDKKLMTQVVPWVPYLWVNNPHIVGPRVTQWQYDQFSGTTAYAHVAVS